MKCVRIVFILLIKFEIFHKLQIDSLMPMAYNCIDIKNIVFHYEGILQMMIKKKITFFLLSLTLIFTFSSCGSSDNLKETETTTPALSSKMPVLVAPNIISEVGAEIDYMANLSIANATTDDYFSINVHSSSVDINTPGEYSAIYMAEYAKGMISKQVSVTIVEALSEGEPLPSVIIEEVTTSDNNQIETTISEANSGNVIETTKTQVTSPSSETTTTKPTDTQVSTTSKGSIPSAVIELSNGTNVEIKNSDTRYVVRTFSDDTYSEKNGDRYLTSELKVEFNTGEIQILETIVTKLK